MKLKDFVEGRVSLLTVMTTEAYLTKFPKKTLEVILDENSEILTSSQERKNHFINASSGWLYAKLADWEKPEIKEVRIATPKYPLEVVTGDVCLILVIEGEEYFLSAFRDILPVGWVIPGGCPKNLEEVFYPNLTARRKTVEEVLIGDTEGRIYPFISLEETVELARKWKLKPEDEAIVMLLCKEIFSGKGDATSLIVRKGREEAKTENTMLIVDPRLASVSATFYLKVELPIKLSELRIFDGEFNETTRTLINRPVRLTKDGELTAIFVSGQNILSAGWNTPRTQERATL